MSTLIDLVNELITSNVNFLKIGFIPAVVSGQQLTEEPNGEWLHRCINPKIIKKIDNKDLSKDFIKKHMFEVNRININLFEFMEETEKDELRKKIVTLLLALLAQDQSNNNKALIAKNAKLEKRCQALLTLLNNPGHIKALQEVLNPLEFFVAQNIDNNASYLKILSNLEEATLEDKKTIEDISYQLIYEVDAAILNDYIQNHNAEIQALNSHFFKVMSEEKKNAYRKKITALLLALLAQDLRQDIYRVEIDKDLEKHYKALLTLLDDSNHVEARQILVKKPTLDPVEREMQNQIDWYQSIVNFELKKSLTGFFNNPLPRLYVLSKQLEDFIAYINNERLNWILNESMAPSAAENLIHAKHFNPLYYSTGLAHKNLDAIGQVTDHLSYSLAALSLILEAFQLGVEMKYSKHQTDDESYWLTKFWEQVPEETKHKLLLNLVWSIANSLSFWLAFGLKPKTIIGGELTVQGLGLIISIAGMLFELGSQIMRLVSLHKKLVAKIEEKDKLDSTLKDLIRKLESAPDAKTKISIEVQMDEIRQQQKALRIELRQIQLDKNTLGAEILIVTLNILIGLTLMALGPFGAILPAVGSIVNMVCLLVFTIIQHGLKISSLGAYCDELAIELKEKNDLFTGEDTNQQRLLYLEILELENEIATQKHLYETQIKIFIRTILIKLFMQTLIFFALSIAPLSLALVSIGFSVIESKLINLFTNCLWEPKPLPEIPEVNGGYSLCYSKAAVSDKKLFIEKTTNNKLLVHYQFLEGTRIFEIPISDELTGIEPNNINKYFTKILKITSDNSITPRAYDFESKFQGYKNNLDFESKISNHVPLISDTLAPNN